MTASDKKGFDEQPPPPPPPPDTDDEMELMPPTPPDGGWGWVVVFASLMTNAIVDGMCTYSFVVNIFIKTIITFMYFKMLKVKLNIY